MSLTNSGSKGIAMKPKVMRILGLFFLCALFLLFIKMLKAGSFERLVYHWDAPLYLFAFCLISLAITKLIKQKIDRRALRLTDFTKYITLSVVSTIVCTTLITALTFAIESLIFGKHRSTFSYFVEWMIIGTFLTLIINGYISYLYLGDLSKMRENLLLAQRAQVETQLRLLQQKVDPHFLFNNLNVLSALVERNPEAASEFVTHFTRLYRYILQHKDAEIVPLDQELAFVQDYIYLVEKRFGQTYRFGVSLAAEQARECLIIPTALQGLIENAVKHNEGSTRSPLPITIAMDGDYLTVSNYLRPKSSSSYSAGTGLENLQARYRLLTDKPVEVSREAGIFAVKVPLLKVVNA
jgi:two-component system LytT family sensor kinase